MQGANKTSKYKSLRNKANISRASKRTEVEYKRPSVACAVTDPEISISGVNIVYHKYLYKIYKFITNKIMTSLLLRKIRYYKKYVIIY